METTLSLSEPSRFTAGVLLLTIVTIELGGMYLLRIVRGAVPATPFQLAFARAGHAHAGVLVILALVCQLLIDAVDLAGFGAIVARTGVAAAAVLMSAGFFLSSAGTGRSEPNGMIALVYVGAASLAAGSLTLGWALVSSA
ncbi:MAG TPA: hypothetical protein VNC60_05465 [Actinomycetota bacterium]|nr:hypothetical protein [Actinomycetota bacterium]